MEEQKIYKVYIRKNKVNNKIYVGMTRNDIMGRWHSGNGYANNHYLINDIKKYGRDAFEHIIIKDCLTREEAKLLEQQTIIELNATDPNTGYNCVCKGAYREETKAKISNTLTGTHISEETKQKISNAQKGKFVSEETRQKLSLVNKGKKRSEESRQRMRKAQKGRKTSEETKAKLRKANSGENSPMYGKQHSAESIAKMSAIKMGENNPMYGRHHSTETRLKMSGKIWITNGKINKLVKPNQLDEYLSNGFVKGRFDKGRIRVTNGIDNKSIWPEQLDEYLSNGYYKGMNTKRKRKEE